MDQGLFERIYETVVNREPTYDGIFYTGVRTTGIVCRPSCRARTPRAENVAFYRSLEDAVAAGFRPCKRCRPEEGGRLRPDAVLAAQADAVMETSFRTKLTLEALSGQLKVSPYHLQRTYKRVTGYTPAAKLDALRLSEAKRLLSQSGQPAKAVAETVGFRGASHFAAWFADKTGVTPTEYRMRMNPKGGR
ncbi:bifunctional transcriptional activator/DNA repair enzyme AdaA [Paenibacillus sp. NFR01]|uniref:bifunctional transcriptional activator/DNA repair enzyme AdaA n=1 Tax=Paenibacillus sp. NFR01 TaxID=1566279 RepID=UPI0008D3E185|nr:Ada metal-binding domain-containing protein [Paenibacillus sp. NFR01]SEU23425.1 AraC family transcriptional regulator, regulatory protein of adaptative response / methylphosphotriester-DNA alkyltransferase methyltransferase [Paenibacillus sp. NFR01]